MKKQIFTLLLGAAILTTTPLFAMDVDEELDYTYFMISPFSSRNLKEPHKRVIEGDFRLWCPEGPAYIVSPERFRKYNLGYTDLLDRVPVSVQMVRDFEKDPDSVTHLTIDTYKITGKIFDLYPNLISLTLGERAENIYNEDLRKLENVQIQDGRKNKM